MIGEIKDYGDGNPLFSIEIEGLTYEFSIADIPDSRRDWFVSMLSNQLTDMHSRTIASARKRFTDAAKELFGL